MHMIKRVFKKKAGILWDASLKFKNLQNHVFQSWYLLLQVKFPGSTLQEYDATETVAAPTRVSGMHLTCMRRSGTRVHLRKCIFFLQWYLSLSTQIAG